LEKMHAPTLLTTSPTPLAEWELQFQIQQALSNKLTGLIQITFLNGKTETIFASKGKVQGLYVRNHRLPSLNWDIPLGRYGRGTLSVEPLPARALLLRKVILEEIAPPQAQSSSSHQLNTMFSLAEHEPAPTLFHIQWQKADGLVLVAGGRIPIRHAVLITPAGMEEGDLAMTHISTWEETRCTVTALRGDIKNQAWLELHLNILLEWYCQRILNHYKHITGAVMVRSIMQNLAILAETKGWNISTQGQQLRDASLFSSAAKTADAYREMLSAIRSRIEPIIGSSLTQNLLRQSIEPTKGVYKIIQETFKLVEEMP
jgi:hypothetical protein